jgi:hypothetical protein
MISKNNIAILVLAIALIITLSKVTFYQSEIKRLQTQKIILDGLISEKEKKVTEQKKIIEFLRNDNVKIVEKIKTIKEKEYVQIKIVDSMLVSELQSFFAKRYDK